MEKNEGASGSASGDWKFGQVEYTVYVKGNDAELLVQVEDKLSADVWKASFTSKQLEDLTQKTGNFKQFGVFVSMLTAAVARSSDSVTLDLLTYADLEALRGQKFGHTSYRGMSPASKTSLGQHQQKQLHSKRYLILTYSVEFDRIHYPLALPYAGKLDPAVLQETIRKLRVELQRQGRSRGRGHDPELVRLQQENESLLQEKEELEELFEAFKSEVMLSRDGAAAKQIKILKQAIRNLEEELAKERSKHQRYVQKKTQEIRELMEELDEVRGSERNLQIRLRSINNELNVMKQGQFYSRGSVPSSSHPRRGAGRSGAGRPRTSSTEKQLGKKSSSVGSKYRMRTPSPSGSRVPRFDPTAYISEKLRRQQESDMKLGRLKATGSSGGVRSRSASAERLGSGTRRPPRPSPVSTRLSGSNLHKPRSRTSSVGSNASSRASSRSGSRQPSLTRSDSESSLTLLRGGRRKGGQNVSAKRLGQSTVRQAWESPQESPALRDTSGTTRKVAGRKTLDTSMSDRSMELSEIDARLSALQEFMKKSLASRKQPGIS